MNCIDFQYRFHAVGQGLFASGCLQGFGQRFDWVFDCGTCSSGEYIQREIDRLRACLDGRSIGLFCLSHFDKDHINGARVLLSQQKVDLLVMPYIPLFARIQIAFDTPDVSDDFIRFLIDPAGYMIAAGGENLVEIMLVAGGGERPEEGDGGDTPLDFDGGWSFRRPKTELPEVTAEEGVLSLDGVSPKVRVFRHDGAFTVGGVWEFLFYNKLVPNLDLKRLSKEVVEIIQKFRRSDGSFDGVPMLKDLKATYRKMFGSSGRSQNRISLVTYSGPVGLRAARRSRLCGKLLPTGIDFPCWRDHCLCAPHNSFRSKVGVSYFGDFLLDSSFKAHHIQRHFGRRRWDDIQVFQVPHHGAKKSWYPGAAAGFQGQVGVISAGRNRRHHPSDFVLNELANHVVFLVNEMQGALFSGHVCFGGRPA